MTGPLYTCRPDLIGFVNGLPLLVIEFKKPGVPARAAFEENITSYKHPQNGIPAFFWYNALIIASNGTESRVGSHHGGLGADASNGNASNAKMNRVGCRWK